ncbi:hypothetical protein LguiA_033250 [Lonicera macranthoides]
MNRQKKVMQMNIKLQQKANTKSTMAVINPKLWRIKPKCEIFYGSLSRNSNEGTKKKVLDEEYDMDLAYVLMMFPSVYDESLSNVYKANNGDLEVIVDMLSEFKIPCMDNLPKQAIRINRPVNQPSRPPSGLKVLQKLEDILGNNIYKNQLHPTVITRLTVRAISFPVRSIYFYDRNERSRELGESLQTKAEPERELERHGRRAWRSFEAICEKKWNTTLIEAREKRANARKNRLD